jgi:hypothetical protein
MAYLLPACTSSDSARHVSLSDTRLDTLLGGCCCCMQVADLLTARKNFIADMSGLLQSRARVRDLINSSLSAARATHIGGCFCVKGG